MSLPRMDVRARFDHDIHEALLRVSALEGMHLAEWVEREIERKLRKILHDARLLVSQIPSSSSVWKNVDKNPADES